MSNLDQKIENAANKIEVAANEAWKSGHSALYLSLYLLRQKSD